MIHTHPFLFVLLVLGAVAFFLAAVLRPFPSTHPLANHWLFADFRIRLIAVGLLFAAIVTLYLNAQ